MTKIDKLMSIAEMYADGVCTQGYFGEHRDALRSALEAALKPGGEPLTQTEVVDEFCKLPHQVQHVSVFDAGVRFAEKHHGIGVKP